MEYLAETSYRLEDYEDWRRKFQSGLYAIQQEYPFYDINLRRAVTTSQDFTNLKIKLKPFPDDMPEDFKNRVLALFQELSNPDQ